MDPSSRSCATHNCVPSHGIDGWFHWSHVRRWPSGDNRGDEEKSLPSTRTESAPLRTSMVAIVLTHLVSLVVWSSRTQNKRCRPASLQKSAYRILPSDVRGSIAAPSLYR